MDLDDRAIGPRALEVMGDRRTGKCNHLFRELLRVTRAVVSAAGVEQRQFHHRQRRPADKLGREVEQAAEFGVEGDEIEIAIHQRNPARDVLDDRAQLFAALTQRMLLAPQFGDILDGAGGTDRRALAIPNHLAGILENALVSVGQADTVVDRIRFAAGDRALHEQPHADPVLGVDALQEEIVVRLRHEVRRDVEEAIALFRPPQAIRHEIALPAADAADLLRFRQPVGHPLQLLARGRVALPLLADQVTLGLPKYQRDTTGDDDQERADEDHQADAFMQRLQDLALVDLGDEAPIRPGNRLRRGVHHEAAVIDALHHPGVAACGVHRRQRRQAGIQR